MQKRYGTRFLLHDVGTYHKPEHLPFMRMLGDQVPGTTIPPVPVPGTGTYVASIHQLRFIDSCYRYEGCLAAFLMGVPHTYVIDHSRAPFYYRYSVPGVPGT